MALIALTLFSAALAIGLTGYGFGLVAMGILPYVLTVAESNAIVAVLGLAVVIAAVVPLRKAIEWRLVVPLIAGAAAGVPVGVFYLVRLDERVLRISLGVVILFALAVSLWTSHRARQATRSGRAAAGARPEPQDEPWRTRLVAAVVGLASGALGGAFSVGGPPVVLFLNAKLTSKRAVKASLIAYFTFVIALRLPILAASGVLTGSLLLRSVMLAPAVAAGLILGTVLHNRLSSEAVRRVIQVLLAVSAVMMIAGA